MDDFDWNRLIDAWISYIDTPDEREREQHWWAHEQVIDWETPPPNNQDMLWNFILKTYQRHLSDCALHILAFGPLQSLIEEFGAEYIDRIEKLAREDPAFNHLLGGVCGEDAPAEIRARVEKVRNSTW